MFILLMAILTVISISLRLGASSIELAIKVSARKTKNSDSLDDNLGKFAKGVASVSLATSMAFMKLSAFIVARVRDLIGLAGSFIMIVELIVIVVVIGCVSSYSVLFMDDEIFASSGNVTSHSSTKVSSSVSGTSDTTIKPSGISEDSWNSADDVGKVVVIFASNAIINPPNGKYLLYKQGDTPQGYADCSTFVSAVIEGSLHKTFAGVDAPDGYDFAKNRKSDLKSYKDTYSMMSIVGAKKECIIGSTATNLDKAQPGDILLRKEHVGIYVGVNENGKHIMVHASSHSNPHCNGDINLEDGQVLEVGFSEVAVRKDLMIIRTSKLLGLE